MKNTISVKKSSTKKGVIAFIGYEEDPILKTLNMKTAWARVEGDEDAFIDNLIKSKAKGRFIGEFPNYQLVGDTNGALIEKA